MKYWFNMGIQPTKVGFWDHVLHVLLRSIGPLNLNRFSTHDLSPRAPQILGHTLGAALAIAIAFVATHRGVRKDGARHGALDAVRITPQRAGWICGRAELDPKHWNWERHEKDWKRQDWWCGKIFRLVTFRSVVCFQGVAVSIADPCWNGIVQSCISSCLVSENHTMIWHPEHRNVAMDQYLNMQIFWGYAMNIRFYHLFWCFAGDSDGVWPTRNTASIASLLPNLPSALAFRVLDSLASSFLGSAIVVISS